MPERKTKIGIPPETTPADGFDVPVEESTDRLSELKLEDGSILRVKPIIARPELAFIIATRAILGARRSGRPSP
jgi:hypothetical protein